MKGRALRSDRSSLKSAVPGEGAHLLARLWTYQAERFPLANHGVLTLVFAASACAYAAGVTGSAPAIDAIVLATLTGLCQFLLLRIADEHKDYATDLAHRSYRAVPRGLVTLFELRVAGAVAIALMLGAIVAAGNLSLVALSLGVWLYFALMSFEFFVGDWLKRQPVLYLASHMVITPLIAWLLAGFQLAYDGAPMLVLPQSAWAFLVSAFFIGAVLELGRKIRSTNDEEPGVETYSALWGPMRARNAWLVTAALAEGAMLLAVAQVKGSLTVALILGGAGIATAVVTALRFRPALKGQGKRIETAASLFALAMLLALGLAPHMNFAP